MPRGDGTGPNGQGPQTGRGLGFCSGYQNPGYTKLNNRGMERNFGRGIGRRRFYQNSIDNNQETTAILEDTKNLIQQKLEDVEKRLKKIEKSKK